MMEWLAVFLGGGLGSLARMGISRWVGTTGEGFPLATFLTNILACLVLGFVAGLVAQRVSLHPALRLGITVGFCGGFSTFSTFSAESVGLLEGGKWMVMGVYVGASVTLCFLGLWLGQWLSRQWG